ncbi:MAG: PIN domain-containing protein [Deltaproteobacteria bacterium]|nr:PIN domain-containing protein [Deltaproteobacteria bacterium]
MILLDTSGLLAAIDASQRQHAACAKVLRNARGPLVLSPFVLAELDYLLVSRVSVEAELAFLGEVARGAYSVDPFGANDVEVASSVIEKYRELEIGVADASIVVLAQRHGVRDLLTLDERHFRVVRRLNGRPFRLLPADI